MQRFLFLFSLVLICLSLEAQVLKAKVINISGEAIPYSSIYIHELMLGIVADENGNFQTNISPGNYSCEVRSIGYETQKKSIQIASNTLELQFVLVEKPTILSDLLVKPSKENPAYHVMRNAIARAPFHLYQVNSYSAANYMKGSAKIESIPTVMKMMIKDKQLKSLIGKLLVLESQNEVTYQSPEKYTQKVIAFKSSIPKELVPKGGLRTSTSSIYKADFMGYISPLSTQAFRYYNFKLEDFYTSGKYQINKIRIIPKVKNDKLFSGYLYITEDVWCVFYADLSTNEMGSSSRYKINYHEIKPAVFLPITFEMNSTIGTMGVKGYAKYYASVKYNSITLKDAASIINIQKPTIKNPDLQLNKVNKTDSKIEKLLSKPNISTKDAIQLSKLMMQKNEPLELREQRESLEIKEFQRVAVEVDSLAEFRDSIYWERIRKVPLLKDEAISFQQKDSFAPSKSLQTTDNSISFNIGTNNKSLKWLLGSNVKITDNISLKYDGLLPGIIKEYNFVDGFRLGQKLTLDIKTSPTNNIIFNPSIYYTTARKTAVWEMNTTYNYAPLSNAKLNISFGNISEDVQCEKGSSRFLNSLSSLFFGDNVIRFYQKEFFKIENSFYIINGLSLRTGAGHENRQSLENNSSLHFFGNKPLLNYPVMNEMSYFENHSSTMGWLYLNYTPKYRYKIKDGKKEYVSSRYPTVGIGYKTAFALTNHKNQSHFNVFQANISQDVKISVFNRLNYSIIAGMFVGNSKMYAPDYKYFSTTPLFVGINSFNNTFQLLDNYRSSATKWLESHINWTSDYLLLKRISFLQTQQFNESLHLNILLRGESLKPYFETGYSIGLGNFGRVGVFAGFEGFKYQKTGVKISLPLFR